MKTTILSLLSVVTATVASAQTPTMTCERLGAMTLAGGSVTSSVTVPAGQFAPPQAGRGGRAAVANPYADVRAFCRVMAQLKPSADSDVRIEVWLPVNGCNGKLQVVGNGGFAGAIG
ncbi:MAG: hypothetical protein ABL986_11595 [Vicinamibacterales bacterium]